MVEINPDLTSALKPFGLISKPIPTTPPAEFRRLEDFEIQRSQEKQASDFAANTLAMSQSLKAASEQVRLVSERSWKSSI